jgi:methylated-DNA-[protein]-cysteine S-methyltransferase
LTEVGRICLAEREGAICDLFLSADVTLAEAVERPTRLLTKASRQVREYFAGRRQVFDLPIILDGTDFERAVWAAVRAIPYGYTASYSHIAEAAGRPRAARAVGAAVRRGRISLIIPFHRVIRSDGSVAGGPCGELRQRLLDLEERWMAR